MKEKRANDPNMSDKDARKKGTIAITKARQEVGASGKDTRINITDDEWKAIQAGAISGTKLSKILSHADPDRIKELAIPKKSTTLSPAQVNKIKAMSNSNFLTAEIAKLSMNAERISYCQPKYTCPKCETVIEETEMTAQEMLFMRHQLALVKTLSIE